MKKTNLIILFLAGIMLTILPVSCGNDDDPQPTPQPPIEVDRSNMFGIGAYPNLGDNIGGSTDEAVTKEMVANLCGAMGVKSFRMLMHLHWLVEFDGSGKLKLKTENVNKYKEYISLLKANGIVNIVATSPSYPYPYGHARTYWLSIPDPETDHDLYIEFLEVIEEAYKLISAEFPDINYYEYGNEINAPNGHNMSKNGFLSTNSAEQNAPYVFTDSQLAAITADIGYYATRGLKSINPKVKTVQPGLYLMNYEDTKNHMKHTYEQIKSGKLPSSRIGIDGKREIAVDTNANSYFEYLNWHPYIHAEHNKAWLRNNQAIYQVATDFGDYGKKVLITEFGYYDSFLERREEQIADACVPAIEALAEALPAMESIFLFRMFNWTTAPKEIADAEKSFGLFDSPLQPKGARPKPIAVSLFYHFNGVNANSDPLFQYMK